MREMLRTKTPSLMTPAGNLSGGNQQKIVIAKWLLGDLKVLILDEPTRGIDVGSKSEIHKLMTQFAQQGLAIIRSCAGTFDQSAWCRSWHRCIASG